MRLPSTTATAAERVRFGMYVARRCNQAGYENLGEAATRSSRALLLASRALDDAGWPVQDAMADRDAADDALDDAARTIRLGMASRSVPASRERPYLDVFPDGIEHYTAATLDDQSDRYGELIRRLQDLPEGDAARGSAAGIRTMLDAWEAAIRTLAEARTGEALARTSLESATEDWERQMERTWGILVERAGRKVADRFFPRRKRAPSDEEQGFEAE